DERYPTRPPAKAPGPASVPPYSFGWTSSAIIPLVCPQFDRWADQIDGMTPRAGSGAPGCGVPARRPSPPTPSRRRLFAFTAARLSSSAPRTDRSQVSRSATKRFTRTLHTDGHPHSRPPLKPLHVDFKEAQDAQPPDRHDPRELARRAPAPTLLRLGRPEPHVRQRRRDGGARPARRRRAADGPHQPGAPRGGGPPRLGGS